MKNLSCQEECSKQPINNFYYGCGCCKDMENQDGTAIPTIGENGNWYIGEEDTGIKALGEDGRSAYQTAVDNGFTGTELEWLESLKGNPGSKGDKGDKGDTGNQGPIGSFAKMDLLFEGTANTIGNVYSLQKSITNYKILIVEFGAYVTASKAWSRNHIIIADPKPSTILFEHGGIHSLQEGNSTARSLSLYYHFTAETSFRIDQKTTYEGCEDMRISKIYGIN